MHRRIIFQLAACTVFCVLTSLSADQKKVRVVASTTHIGALVQEIGGGRVAVKTLIPGGTCPGHYDMEPGTAKHIAAADLFICHSWQTQFNAVMQGLSEKHLKEYHAETTGNWMIPDVRVRAAQEITMQLVDIDPKGSAQYKHNLHAYKKHIIAESKKILKQSAPFKNIPVLCSSQQKEFLEWLGFKVVGTYGRPEDFNLKTLTVLMQLGKLHNVRLVVDNLQSGPNAGEALAEELKVPRATVSNFPENNSYIKTLMHNINSLRKALL